MPPGIPSVVHFALVERLDHVRIIDILHCLTVALTASDFSRTVFLFLVLEEELDVHARCGFFDHVEHLVFPIQSLAPPFFHVLLSVLHTDSENLE